MKKYRIAYIVFLVFVFGIVFFSQCFLSFAMEETEVETESTETVEMQEDISGLNERVNALELRLEELGFTINELNNSITLINENTEAIEAERLTLSQDMEILIVGMNALIEQNIEYLTYLDNTALYQGAVTTALSEDKVIQEEISGTLKLQSENTVSGNAILTNTLSESSENTSKNIESIIFIVVILIGVCLGIAGAFMLAKGLFKNGN